jgi:Zn-dependent protease with chaperone function
VVKAVWRKIKLAFIFLTIPVVCYFALDSSVSDQEREWNAYLQKEVPARTADFPLQVVCYAPPADVRSFDFSPVCSPYINAIRFRALAVYCALGTLCFWGLIFLCGRLSKSNRIVLLRIFRPGLLVVNIVVASLLILQAVLVSSTFFYAAYRNEPGKKDDAIFYSCLFGAAAAAGVFFTLKPLFKKHTAQATVVGKSVTLADSPMLWAFVKNLAGRTQSDVPRNLVVGLTPEFFVTEAEVQCIDGKLEGRTIYISAPLCRIMTVQELEAVIAHELGHFKGEDTAFTLHFYPIYRGAIDSLNGVSEAATSINKVTAYIPIAAFKILGLIGSLSLFPTVYMLAFFLECFAAAENTISRERELAADAVAATTAGSANIATALVKIVAFTATWSLVVSTMRDSLVAGYFDYEGMRYDARQFFSNISGVYAATVASHAGPAVLSGLDSKIIPHPTDTHPPLSARLAALRHRLADIQATALNVTPNSSASTVIDNVEELEALLSYVEQELRAPSERVSTPLPPPLPSPSSSESSA